MKMVDVEEANVQFSRLLEEVERGEVVVIARNGVAVARLTAVAPTTLRDAVERVRSEQQIAVLSLDVKALIDEGRG